MKKLLLFLVLFTGIVNITKSQWIQTNGPYGGQNISCLAVSGANIFAGTSNGVFISSDDGNLWTQVNNGLTNKQVRALVISGANIFAGTYGGVFLSTNNGNTWTAVSNGLPSDYDTIVMSMVIKGTDIYAGIYTQTGGVYKSSNNGSSWSAVNNGLPFDSPANSYEVLQLGVSGNNIFAQPRTFGMYISTDDGASWTAVNNGFQNDPNSHPTFVSNGTDIYIGNTYGVFYSNNNGSLWTNLNNGLPSNGVFALCLSGTNIFAGTNNGVCLSTNNCGLWTNVSTNGIASLCVNSFVVKGTNIFAGTSSSGVWKRPISEMTGIEETNNNSCISFFPNPTIDKLTIIASDQASIEISNINGQIIKSIYGDKKTTVIDLTDLSSGIYFMRVKTDKEIVTKKIIKE